MRFIKLLSPIVHQLLALSLGIGLFQATVSPLAAQSMENQIEQLNLQLGELTKAVLLLREEVADSREENRELRATVRRLLERTGSTDLTLTSLTALAQTTSLTATSQQTLPPQTSAPGPSSEERLSTLEENQELLSSRLEEQYQTKVESASRYRTRFSGVVMMSAFRNWGRVDDSELPNAALSPSPLEESHSIGMSLLQSQLGFETYGAEIAGARTSAGIQFDFFGTHSDTDYARSWGSVRLRTATVRLDWKNTSLVAGQDTPFISPLSPTSAASLGYPAFSFSGNLWDWIPQARMDRRITLSEKDTFTVQAGVFDPSPRTSGQPGYATRLAWSHGESERPLSLGIGAYYDRQDRGYGRTQEGWAGTADWVVPVGDRLTLSGEFFRGRAIGGLGAAQGRSVVYAGSSPLAESVGLDAVGGWAQLSFKASSTVEFNVAHGEDQPYGQDLVHFASPGPYDRTISRNRGDMFNAIYRPRTDLLFSLEYRHLKTWHLDSKRESADHLNLGIGVLF